MITLQYPTTGNNRSVPKIAAAWGECIQFSFDMSGGIVNIGAAPYVEITMGTTVPANGTSFTINNAFNEYTVDNTITDNTNRRINLTTNAETNARRMGAMLASNDRNAGNRITIFLAGSLWKVRMDWPTKTAIVGAFTNNVPAGYSVSAFAGTTEVILPGFALAYRVWMNDELFSDVLASPKFDEWNLVFPIGLSPLQIEINDILRPFLKTSFPFTFPLFSGKDYSSRWKFWIEYGYATFENCTTIYHEIQKSPEEFVMNAALQESDYNGMLPYVTTAAGVPRLALTRRPNWCVPRGVYDWIWILMEDQARRGLASVNYYSEMEYLVGTTWTLIGTNFLGTTDGVYRIPTGTRNNTAVPPNASKMRLSIFVDQPTGADIQVFEQEIIISDCQPYAVMWFENGLGGFDLISFEDFVSTEVVVEQQVECLFTGCIPRQFTTNTDTETTRGGKRVINTLGMEKITVQSEPIRGDGFQMQSFINAFLTSKERYIKFLMKSTALGTIVNDGAKAVYIDSGSFKTFDDEGGTRLEISFYSHKEITAQN